MLNNTKLKKKKIYIKKIFKYNKLFMNGIYLNKLYNINFKSFNVGFILFYLKGNSIELLFELKEVSI